jgi:bifunctional enzyme CysN/CysC
VTVLLEDNIDISRGDMIVGSGEHPTVTRSIEATVCWMTQQPLQARSRYIVRHTTREVRGLVDEVVHKIDVHTLEPQTDVSELGLNDIGSVKLRLSAPLVVDDYRRNRETGSFILIDEATNATVGAAMITAADSLS